MALAFLETILGEAYTEDIDKKISEEIGKDFQRGQGITADGVFGKKSLEKAKALINRMKE